MASHKLYSIVVTIPDPETSQQQLELWLAERPKVTTSNVITIPNASRLPLGKKILTNLHVPPSLPVLGRAKYTASEAGHMLDGRSGQSMRRSLHAGKIRGIPVPAWTKDAHGHVLLYRNAFDAWLDAYRQHIDPPEWCLHTATQK